jgi:hypothetical protein
MKWLISLLLGLLLTFFMRDLAKPGLPMLHDSNPHIARMIAFHAALEDGQLPPMWARDVLGGIGSPVMMLNYQLPYFITEAFARVGFSYFDSYKLVLALSFVLSGLLMYFALKSKYGVGSAWVGSLIYTLAPYRFVDIYVRGALGESLSFIFPPLLIWGFTAKSWPVLIIGWAGLFLTHPVVAAAFSAFFMGYTLLFGVQESLITKLKDFFGPYLIALIIAMFNLLPTLALTKYTYYAPSLSDTLLMFPTLGQLIQSPWGYGVSLPGPNDGMSFEIGIVGWIILFAGSVWALLKKDTKIGYLSGASWLTIALILPISLPLYTLLLGNIIDFPWRLLLCIVFASAWMGAELLDHLSIKPLKYLIGVAIVLTLIAQSLPIARTDKYWDKPLTWFARETGDSYGEYAPLTRNTRDSAPFWYRAEFVRGVGTIDYQIQKSNHQKYLINSTDGGEVRINTAFFPGWVIPANCFITTRTLSHIDDSGLIGCKVEQGEQTIEIKFIAPPVQRVGNLITLAGIGIYLWILFRSFYRHTMREKQ